jgi:hypothetical protein
MDWTIWALIAWTPIATMIGFAAGYLAGKGRL